MDGWIGWMMIIAKFCGLTWKKMCLFIHIKWYYADDERRCGELSDGESEKVNEEVILMQFGLKHTHTKSLLFES
jgi:hypothetical protein